MKLSTLAFALLPCTLITGCMTGSAGPVATGPQAGEMPVRRVSLSAREASNLRMDAFKAWQTDKDYAKAEKLYERSLKIEADAPKTFIDMARMYETRGQFAKAWTSYKRVLRPKDPKAPRVIDPLILVTYAELSERLGHPTEADWAFLEAANVGETRARRMGLPSLKKSGKNLALAKSNALIVAGWRALNSAKLSRGLALLHRSTKEAPKSGVAHYYLALRLVRMGHMKKARPEYAEAVRYGKGELWFKEAVAWDKYLKANY